MKAYYYVNCESLRITTVYLTQYNEKEGYVVFKNLGSAVLDTRSNTMTGRGVYCKTRKVAEKILEDEARSQRRVIPKHNIPKNAGEKSYEFKNLTAFQKFIYFIGTLIYLPFHVVYVVLSTPRVHPVLMAAALVIIYLHVSDTLAFIILNALWLIEIWRLK